MNVCYYEQNGQQILAFKDPPFDILSDEYSVCCSFELLFFKVEVEIMISKFNRFKGWKQISFFFSFQLDFLNTALEKMEGWRSSQLNQWSWRDHQETKQMLEYFFHISLMWDSFLRALGRQPNSLWAFFRYFLGRMLKITMRLYAALKPLKDQSWRLILQAKPLGHDLYRFSALSNIVSRRNKLFISRLRTGGS